MLPKAHIILGLIFSVLLFFLHITILEASLIFLSSVLIDVDHYLFIIKRKKIWNLKKAFYWHKNLPKDHKPMMHIFHSIEFLILILILSFFIKIFLFILIGLLFHSVFDIFDLLYNKRYNVREFSMIRYLLSKDKLKYF